MLWLCCVMYDFWQFHTKFKHMLEVGASNIILWNKVHLQLFIIDRLSDYKDILDTRAYVYLSHDT